MTALLAIVRSAEEAVAASEVGADAVAVVVGAGPLVVPARRPVPCGVMITENHPDPVGAVADAAAAGFGRIWLPFSAASRSALDAAAASSLEIALSVPLGRALDGGLCDEVLAAGGSELLVAGAPFGATRLLDTYSPATLAGFLALSQGRGLPVSMAGAIEAPDVPRMLALEPATIGLDTLLRDADGRFARERLRAARALWTHAASALRFSVGEPDRIFVRDWTTTMRIGAYASEKGAAQRVRFGVDADIAAVDGSFEGMAGVVSYDLITDAIERLAGEHVDFVETIAEKLAATLLAHPRMLSVAVTVEKLDRGPGSVGCRIVRRRPV